MLSSFTFRTSMVLLIGLCPSSFSQDNCAWDTTPTLDNNRFLPNDRWCSDCCSDGLAKHAFCSTCCGSGSEYYANLTCMDTKKESCHYPLHGQQATTSCCGTDAVASCEGIPLALLVKSTPQMRNKSINCTTHAQTKHYCMRGYQYESGLCIWPTKDGKPKLYCQEAQTFLNNDLPRCYDPKRWENGQPTKLTHASHSACPYDADGNIVPSAPASANNNTNEQQTTVKEDNRQQERSDVRRINRRYNRRRDYYDQQSN